MANIETTTKEQQDIELLMSKTKELEEQNKMLLGMIKKMATHLNISALIE